MGLDDMGVEGGEVLAGDEVCKVHKRHLSPALLIQEVQRKALLICCKVDMVDPRCNLQMERREIMISLLETVLLHSGA